MQLDFGKWVQITHFYLIILILSLPHDHELHDIRISRYVLHDTLWNL